MLKIIAMLTMLIDHVGYVFFPAHVWLRWIGRISMPIFAYGIAIGHKRMKEKDKRLHYFIRLAAFATVSHYPYILVMSGKYLNIGYTWLLSIPALCLYDWARDRNAHWAGRAMALAGVIGVAVIAHIGSVDYRWYGIVTVILMYEYLVMQNKPLEALFAAFVATAAFCSGGAAIYQLFAVLSVPLIYFVVKKDTVRLPKWVGYAFYPCHFLVLYCLKLV